MNEDDDDFDIHSLDFDDELSKLMNEDVKDREWKRRYLNILQQLKNNESSAVFWDPVPLDEVVDYTKYVQRPMDLGKITKNVLMDFYSSDHRLFAKEVRLVWSNCLAYNQKGTPLHNLGLELKAFFESLYEIYFM